MGTIRLGKRTDARSPKVKEFLPLAGLDDLVFTGWDIFEDNMYEAASNAGVLDHACSSNVKTVLIIHQAPAPPSSITTRSKRLTART